MRQEIIDLYDEYTHERLERRTFLDRLVGLTGSTAAAAAILPVLENNYAQAAMVAEDDPALTTERVTFADGAMEAYLAMPADASAPLPGIVVIHENRGLNPHIEDVARRAALAGYVALAPDFLTPSGGTPEDEDQAREMIRALDTDATIEHAVAAVDFLAQHEATNGQVGVVGFCWGGAMANQVAVHSGTVAAAVAFYGRQPDAEATAEIEAPLLLHYAGLDDRINAGIPAYEEALEAAGVDYTIYMYEGVNHAFHNDTNAARYDRAAAELAWQRTMDFFAEHLAG